jgi:hypothetical protein
MGNVFDPSTPAAVSIADAGGVPVGGIVMWSGTILAAGDLSPVWEVCDGTANAPGPDLRDKFIVGASVDDAGAAKTNIEGTLRVSTTATGATLAGHGDHTGLTHDGAVASHADLTHVALSHPALTVVHADHSVPSASHTHASGADVSVPSGTFASAANVSYPSHSHASTAGVSIPSGSAPSGADATVPSFATQSGISLAGTVTRSVVTTGGLNLTHLSTGQGGTVPSYQSKTGVSYPSHSHASAANGSAPSATGASGADASRPSGTIASTNAASRPSLTGSAAAATLTHADHSLASLSHQAIGTHGGLTHAFTPPAAHGAAGTVTHSAHATVPIVPAYFALAFIQRMA